jgi:hypothetical protein
VGSGVRLRKINEDRRLYGGISGNAGKKGKKDK